MDTAVDLVRESPVAACKTSRKNHLLAALPTAEYDRLIPQLELVEMPLGEVLYTAGDFLQYIYFPTTSIVSLLYLLENGASAEIAVVGNEGVLGVSIFLGVESTPSRAIVQTAGQGYRLDTQHMKEELNHGGAMLHVLLRYTQALITQMAQTATCNRHHSVEHQLCRWLLLSLDRNSTTELNITEELIAHLLGISTDSVMEVLGKFQRAGLIENKHGHLRVLSKSGLQNRVCECYSLIRNEFDRLLPSLQLFTITRNNYIN